MNGRPDQMCGFLNGKPLYRVQIPAKDFNRLIELAMEGITDLPDWIDEGQSMQEGRRTIWTTNPGYFDKQKEIRNANTGRDQAGFEQL